MQRQCNIVGLGHAGDLAGLRDAPGVGHVRLNDVDVALSEDAFEVPARVKSFTQGDRCAGERSELLERLVVFAEHGFLDEHRPILLEFLDQDFRHGLVHPAMEIHADANIAPYRFAHGCHICQHRIDLGVAVYELHLFAGIHLYCAEPARHSVPSGIGGIRRSITADPGVHANTLAHPAA